MWAVTTICLPLKRLISFVILHDPAIVSLTDPETSANNDWLTIQGTADTQGSPNNPALFSGRNEVSESLCFHGLPLTQLPHKNRFCVHGDRTRDNEYLMYLSITLDASILMLALVAYRAE